MKFPNPLSLSSFFASGEEVLTVYTPDGRKMREIRKEVRAVTPSFGSGDISLGQTVSDTIDYVGPVTYEGRRPVRLRYAGGYASLIATASKVGSGVSAYTPTFYFYITDYQGNNRGVLNASSGTLDQITHYYPWGSPYADLGKSPDFQPYKFSDKELSTFAGVSRYDFAARTLFPALPRFDRPDHLSLKYPHISPYAFCANNPVNFTDPTGMIIVHFDEDDDSEWQLMKKNGIYKYYNKQGDEYSGSDKFVKKLENAIKDLVESPTGRKLVSYLMDASDKIAIQSYHITEGGTGTSRNGFAENSMTIIWDPDDIKSGPIIEGHDVKTSTSRPSFIGLGHEMGHAADKVAGTFNSNFVDWSGDGMGIRGTERVAGNIENMLRKEYGLPMRYSYDYDAKHPFKGMRYYPIGWWNTPSFLKNN